MGDLDTQLVDIVRDFARAHRALRRVLHRHRAGELVFEDIQELVGEGEASVLYRLKERCHGLFRRGGADGTGRTGEIAHGALFDLAVGSLFHEAMKLRENFYQRWAYGPRVEELRRADVPEARGLVGEFQKILMDNEERFATSLLETDVLLEQTGGTLRAMLRSHRDSGPLARHVVAHREELASVLGGTPEELLIDLYGSEAAAWEAAAWSYLESGFFAEAREALLGARAAEPSPAREALLAYAEGMRAYLEGRYEVCIRELGTWLEAGPAVREAQLGEFAAAGLARVRQLVSDDVPLAERAAALAERIRSHVQRLRAA